MQQFKIEPNGFNEIRKQTLIKTLPLVIILAGIGLAFGIFYNYESLYIILWIAPIIILTSIIGTALSLNRHKKIFESYTLSVSDNTIIREQKNTPTIKILFNDVKEITKNSNGSFTITGKTPYDIILVPKQIDKYYDLETTLNKVHTIKVQNNKLVFPIMLVTLGLMAIVFNTTNKVFLVISGATLIGIIIYLFLQIQQDKNIDGKTKKLSYWIFFLLFSIIGRVIYILLVN